MLTFELTKLQTGTKSAVPGATICRIADVTGLRLGKDLGLRGELAAILLRWGHCDSSMVQSLCCCPERRELLQTLSPEWIARTVGGTALAILLECGGHVSSVTPDWLRAHVPAHMLFRCLKAGGHLSEVSADWLVAHLPSDDVRVYALALGGQLYKVTADWIIDNIKQRDSLIWALVESDELQAMRPDLVSACVPVFEDLVDHLCNTDPSIDPHWLCDVYRAAYQDPRGSVDLAEGLIRLCIARSHCSYETHFDAPTLFGSLRGVPAELVCQLIDLVDTLYGVPARTGRRHRGDRSGSWSPVYYMLQAVGGWTDDEDAKRVAKAVAMKCSRDIAGGDSDSGSDSDSDC